MDVQGKVAVVTGAGVRLGRAIALALGELGAQVVVHYHRSRGPADETVAMIASGGGVAVAVQHDLAQAAEAGVLIEAGVAQFGQVDILVNSAAIFERATLLETTEDNYDRHMAINLKAPFFLCQAYARQHPAGQRGHIINIADWRATRPGTAYMAYTLAKAGLITLTQSLALALGPDVQVNAIAPGAILPPPGDDGAYFRRLAERIPAKRTGSPEEVVQAVRYLLASDFVTGELLYVTGGEHL